VRGRLAGTAAEPTIIVLSLLLLLASPAAADLRRYIEADDGAYRWEAVAQTPRPDGTIVHELQLTSQIWQGMAWRHRLRIVAPAEPRHAPALALLLIAGGDPADQQLHDAALMAARLGAPVAVLYDVPNQPLFGGLSEDDLLAYTFAKFLDTRDATWPLLLPMVKGVVKAMDAAQAFLARQLRVAVDGFVVSGASKRGWTAWLTPVVDERVRAIAPLVYDNLDLARQLRHQQEAWGDVSGEIGAYTERRLPQRLLAGEPAAVELAALVDPFSYRQQLRVPKLIVLGTNDRYWPLDALNLYYDALPGERYLLYLANAGHDLRPGRDRALAALMALFQHAAGRQRLPTLRWQVTADGGTLRLQLTADRPPQAVRAWLATAPSRDFRAARWQALPMPAEADGYVYRGRLPPQHLTAIFAEAEYTAASGPFTLSTTVSVVP
jgi:PhoPQ-activated pathogenicity-related protein